MDRRDHWEKIYHKNKPDKLGWFKPHLDTSLEWIKSLQLNKGENIIDVGSGASTLVDDLLDDQYSSISVVDISEKALSLCRERLGEKAASVSWINQDITSVQLPVDHFDLWHDRAVFHFLISTKGKIEYIKNLLAALKPGGHLILAVFAPEAPAKCSGLPVERYSIDKLVKTLGDELELKRYEKYLHITPGGVEQMYLYSHFRRLA